MKISNDVGKRLSRGLWVFILICLATEAYVFTFKPSYGIYLHTALALMAVAMLYSVYSATVKDKKAAAPIQEAAEQPPIEAEEPGRLNLNLETVEELYFGVGVLEATALILKNFNLKLAEQGTWQGEEKKNIMYIDSTLSEILYKCSEILELGEGKKPHDS